MALAMTPPTCPRARPVRKGAEEWQCERDCFSTSVGREGAVGMAVLLPPLPSLHRVEFLSAGANLWR